jgi:N,N-dimethylformamidase
MDFSSVLDRTVPGSLQSTMIGSYAEFPLPNPIKDGAVSLHCWVWPTVPEREAPQTVWSLGNIALVIVSGGLALRANDQTLATIADTMVAKHWYSILVTLGIGEASIDLKRLDGKVSAHRTIAVETGATVISDKLLLAHPASGRPDRRCNPSTARSTLRRFI